MSNFNFDLDNNIDEDFFGTLKGKSSKLQQLFGEDSISQDEKQQSLKYQRPKANDLKLSPNNDITDAGTSASQASGITLMAKVVVAYKQGELLGKVGLAFIQNSDNSLSLIIYKTKVYILATTKLDKRQEVLFKHSKYWQFYDEGSIYWSFSFDTAQDEEEFKEKLAKKNLNFKETRDELQNNQSDFKDSEVLQQRDESGPELVKEHEDLKHQTSKMGGKESKNSLIKRMAKMGKPLPTLSSSTQQTTTEFSDSSDAEVINTPLVLAQKPSIAPRSSKLSTIKPNQQLVPSTTVTYNTAATAHAGAVYPIESQYMNMLLTEQRTQGSELRMNMNKLENKIEKVLDKLELFDRHEGKEKPHKDDEILELEEKVLMLKKENRKLKQSLEEKSFRDTEGRKIKEILQEFNYDLKDVNIDFNNDLKTVLKTLIEKLKHEQNEIKENQRKFNDSEIKLKDLQKDLELEQIKTKNYEQKLTVLQEQKELLQAKQQENEKLIQQNEQQINDLRKQLEAKTKEKSENSADSLVKSIMNNLYTDIAVKLDNSNLSNSDRILALIASSIKEQTLRSLNRVKED